MSEGAVILDRRASGAESAPQLPTVRHERFESLDAMRGLAATAVVIFHLMHVGLEPDFLPHAYLAVDFFFLMSGFVVAVAYSKALRGAMSLSTFSLKRAIRLYPIAMMGTLLGLGVLLLKHFTVPQRVDSLGAILFSGVCNLFLVPDFLTRRISHFELFPGNGPLWSLFLECLANMVWAWLVFRLRGKLLAVVVALSWVALLFTARQAGGLNMGFDLMTLAGGVARVFFGFLAGVGMYELWESGLLPRWRTPPLVAVLVLAGVFAVPAILQPRLALVFDFGIVTMVFPVLLILCLAHGAVGRLGRLSGTLSYPIYAIHFPIVLVASGLHQSKPHVNVHLISVAACVCSGIVAYVLSESYDKPLRKMLSRRLADRTERETVREVAP